MYKNELTSLDLIQFSTLIIHNVVEHLTKSNITVTNVFRLKLPF